MKAWVLTKIYNLQENAEPLTWSDVSISTVDVGKFQYVYHAVVFVTPRLMRLKLEHGRLFTRSFRGIRW